MKLDSIVLVLADERRITRTYPNGVDDYWAYQKALNLSPGKSYRDIAAIVNKPTTTVTYWLKGVKQKDGSYIKNRPPCMGAIGKLNDRGLLPLTYHHEKFHDVNLLYALTYWSGFSGKNMLQMTPKKLSEEFEAVLERLDLSLRDTSQPNVKAVSKGATAMNRLFRCMALHSKANNEYYSVSDSLGTREKPMKKSRLKLRLPYYLHPLMDPTLGGKDKKLANRILYDFVSVLFSRRTYKIEGNDFLEHKLLSNRDMGNAKRFALEVEALIKRVIPGFAYRYKPEQKAGHVALRMFFKPEDFPDPNVFRLNKELRQLYT